MFWPLRTAAPASKRPEMPVWRSIKIPLIKLTAITNQRPTAAKPVGNPDDGHDFQKIKTKKPIPKYCIRVYSFIQRIVSIVFYLDKDKPYFFKQMLCEKG